MIQQSYFWACIQKNWKQDLKDICTLIIHNNQKAKRK